MEDLHSVIEDAISDASLPVEDPISDTPEVDASPADDTPTDVVEPVTTASDEPAQDNEPVAEPTTTEVQSPAAKAADPKVVDDFDKKYGLSAASASGRENRIPYSRVKKIVSKAEGLAKEAAKTEWEPKLSAAETRIKEYETRFGQVEQHLLRVGEFEKEMLTNPVAHLNKLIANIPAYAKLLEPLYNPAAAQAGSTQEAQPEADPMPQPDQKLADGSMVYSMKGLEALNTWNRRQAKKEVLEDVRKEYGLDEIKQERAIRAQYQAVLPKVQAQIEKARKWEGFNENEQEIVAALQQDDTLTLDGAYRQVVVPKLSAANEAAKVDRGKIAAEERAKVLAELKKTPRSTSTVSGATKSTPQTSTGPRALEDIIADSIKGLR